MPRIRPYLRFVLAAAFAFAIVLGAKSAFAQTITLPNVPSSIVRVDANGNTLSSRGQANYPYGISLSDCQQDQSFGFPVTITGYNANEIIEVWASENAIDCSQAIYRNGTQQQCWLVTASSPPLVQTQTVYVKMRDILAYPPLQNKTFTQSYVDQDESVCGLVPYSTFSLYFMLTTGGADADSSVEQDILASTIGPPPPSGLSVTQGDTLLELNWDSIGEGGTTTAQYITVFYEEASGQGGVDAGKSLVCKDGAVTETDAGVDEAGDPLVTETTDDGGCLLEQNTPPETNGSCSAPGFFSDGGIDPTQVQSIQVSSFGSQATLTGLTDNVTYAVGLASQDAFLNNGPVSTLTCQSPVKLNDFYQTYRNDGGLAGGGFCALDIIGVPAGGATFAVAAFSTLMALTRRKKREEERASRSPKGEKERGRKSA